MEENVVELGYVFEHQRQDTQCFAATPQPTVGDRNRGCRQWSGCGAWVQHGTAQSLASDRRFPFKDGFDTTRPPQRLTGSMAERLQGVNAQLQAKGQWGDHEGYY